MFRKKIIRFLPEYDERRQVIVMFSTYRKDFNTIRYESFEMVRRHLEFNIAEEGHVFAKKDFIFLLNKPSEVNQLHFIKKGRGYYECKGKRIEMQAGNIYLLPQYLKCKFVCLEEVEKFYIHFNLNFAKRPDMFSNCKKILCIEGKQAEINGIIDSISASESPDVISCYFLLGQIISEFIKLTDEKINYKHDLKSETKYDEVMRYIEKNLSAKLTVKEISERLYYSKTFLYSGFLKKFGFSLKTYINNRLFEIAQYELLFTEKTIKDISCFLDFCNEYHFSAWFKKHSGYSPGIYRKKYAEDSTLEQYNAFLLRTKNNKNATQYEKND